LDNPKVTSIPIPAAGGVPVAITLTIMASKVTVQEDPAYNTGAGQGLQGYYVDTQPPQANPPVPSPATLFVWLANTAGQIGRAYQPIIFGGADGRVHVALGKYVGAEGTVILLLTSKSANPSAVLLEEWS